MWYRLMLQSVPVKNVDNGDMLCFCYKTWSLGSVCCNCCLLFTFSAAKLGGGFRYFLFSPLFGEDSHFD